MKKRTLFISLGSALVIILAAWYFIGGSSEASTDIFISPQRGMFQVTVTATGELQAKKSIKINGPQNAQLAQIWRMTISKLIPEGTVVQKGDFVAELDKSEISNRIKEEQLELQKAESRFTQAQLDTTLTMSKARDELVNLKYAMEEMKLKMEQSQYEAPSVQRQTEIDYEKAERAFDQATRNYVTKEQQAIAQMKEVQAELTQHQQRITILQSVLQQFTIKAPADGMLIYFKEWNGQKRVVGSLINAWDPVVATLPDLSEMESVTYISEVDIQKIKKGQHAKIGLDADPDKKLTGVVTEIANIGEQRPNSDSKVFEVTVLINEADTTLRPAMTTSNTIVADTVQNALHIPLECIHVQDSVTYVYKSAGGHIEKQEVKLGLLNEDAAVIQNGLSETDKIFLSTPVPLPEGDIVRLSETLASKEM